MTPPSLDTVTARTRYHGPCMPKDLCLRRKDEEAEEQNYIDSVYVLRCATHSQGGPFNFYVGWVTSDQLKRRLGTELAQTSAAADYCKRNRPICIEFLWPAASPALEAYIYYALLARLGADPAAKGRVGGWTQTQAHPDKHNQWMIERDRRMLKGSCLGCGKDGPKKHFCKDCQREPDTCPIACGHCSAKVNISSRGTDPPSRAALATSTAAATLAQQQSQRRPHAEEGGVQRRVAPRVQPAAPSPPTPTTPTSFKRVLVAGHEYTTLTWFYGGKRPSYKKRQAVYTACKHSAYVLEHGDTSTLEKAGFATATGKELWPGASYLVDGPKDTCLLSVHDSKAVQLKRPTAHDMRKKSRPVLLNLATLRAHTG